jgi:transcriptional regulator with XRE-family HTH domain
MSDENFGVELRRLRLATDWSLNDLPKRIHYTKGYLSKVENDLAPANATLAALCDAELRTGGTLSARVPRRKRRIKNRTFTLRPAGLPPDTPFFVGRTDETAEIEAILRDTRPGSPFVCPVNGLAGIGKTALTVHAAHRVRDTFPDGVLYLDQHAYTPGTAELDAAQALDRLLRQLAVPAEEIPQSTDDRAVLYRGCCTTGRFSS